MGTGRKCLLVFLVWCGLSSPTFAQPQQQPNIIVILADDLGYETLGCNGGTSYRTPNLDALARGGVRFENAYAMPLCTPSRVQLMTGKYNFRNYVRFEHLDSAERTFANYLRDAGYRTCIAGKWQLGGGEEAPRHFGFDNYCLWQLDKKGYYTRYKQPVITQDGAYPGTAPEDYGEDIFTTYIKSFIAQNKSAPFFIYYPMVLAHAPFQPVPGHNAYDTAAVRADDVRYFGPMVEYMDRKVGEIVAHLARHGLAENTLIMFLGDNGTDTRITSQFRGRAITGNKGFTTAAGIHVPLIVHWPAAISKGRTSDDLVDLTDILPTLFDAAGIDRTGVFTDGISMYRLLAEDGGGRREWIYCNYDAKGRDFPARIFAQDKVYKLYDNGDFYNFRSDPEEKRPRQWSDLTRAEKRAYRELKKVIGKYQVARQTAAPSSTNQNR